MPHPPPRPTRAPLSNSARLTAQLSNTPGPTGTTQPATAKGNKRRRSLAGRVNDDRERYHATTGDLHHHKQPQRPPATLKNLLPVD